MQLFGAGGFHKYSMVIEMIDVWDLWQVTLISKAAIAANRMPDEVFLLENVEQILVGPDRKMAEMGANSGRGMLSRMTHMGMISSTSMVHQSGVQQSQLNQQSNGSSSASKSYALFCLKTATKRDLQLQTIYVVLADMDESDRFCETIKRIQKRNLKLDYNQFLTWSLT